jgi:hypothetical protein
MVRSLFRTGLALGRLADKTLAGLAERHNRGRQTMALGVQQHFGIAALHNGYDGVGRS